MVYEYEIRGCGDVEEDIIIDKLSEAGMFDILVEKDLNIAAFIDEQSDEEDGKLQRKWEMVSQADFMPSTGLCEEITRYFNSAPIKSRKRLAMAIRAGCIEQDICVHTQGILMMKIFMRIDS